MAENQPTPPREYVYHDGNILAAADARLSIDDGGVLYGLGFFETFRTSGGRPHHWNFNLTRLLRACATAGIVVPSTFLVADEKRLRAVVRSLLSENKMSEAVFRYTLTAGRPASDPRRPDFREPTEFLTLRAIPATAPASGIALRVLALSRDLGEWQPRPKSLNYANAIAGAHELRRRAFTPSDEGLFLTRGEELVVETPRQNLGWIADGKLCYPDPALGAVAGTALQWMFQRGFPAVPRRAKLAELLQADAIFVLNAVRGITPVREVWDAYDMKQLGTFSSHAHPVIARLQSAWHEALQATAGA